MLANPLKMIDAGFITNVIDSVKQVQPNAVDWEISSIFQFVDNITPFVISEDGKAMRPMKELVVSPDGYWHLEPNSEYDITSCMRVSIPAGYAAQIVPRSTFVRNGCWLVSGLYDSGYQGTVAGVLHTGTAPVFIAPGTRVGQIMFIHSDSVDGVLYAGGYNTEVGQHWTEKELSK